MSTLSSVAQASMKGPQLIVLSVYDPAVSVAVTALTVVRTRLRGAERYHDGGAPVARPHPVHADGVDYEKCGTRLARIFPDNASLLTQSGMSLLCYSGYMHLCWRVHNGLSWPRGLVIYFLFHFLF